LARTATCIGCSLNNGHWLACDAALDCQWTPVLLELGTRVTAGKGPDELLAHGDAILESVAGVDVFNEFQWPRFWLAVVMRNVGSGVWTIGKK